MRKWIGLGLAALVISAVGVGVIFAQDTATVTRNWLGIHVDETEAGLVVERVHPESPAAAAGVETGDVVLTLDGAALATVTDLRDAVQAAVDGATVTLGVERDGESLDIAVTLETREMTGRGAWAFAGDPLGFAQMLLHADLTAVDGGYEVTNVLSMRNPFALEVGDVVTSLNDLDITAFDPAALHDSLHAADGALTLTVTRGAETLTLEGEMGRGFGPRGGMGEPGGRGDFGGRGQGGPGGMGNGGGQPGGRGNAGGNV